MSEPSEILAALAAHPVDASDRLRAHEDGAAIIAALALAHDPVQRTILCDVLGFRHEAAAVDALVARLADDDARVRSAAADALAKIGDEQAGPALLARFDLPDPDLGVRRMLLAALGAVRYRPAIPTLITWLGNPDPSQRGSAAWSLGALAAAEALAPLEEALKRERISYPAERMREAIAAIRHAAAPD